MKGTNMLHKRTVILNILAFLAWLLLCGASARAQYTVISLHPAGFAWSLSSNTSGWQQVRLGTSSDRSTHPHALLWNGSAASVVDLHPAGFTNSFATGISGGKQVGSGYFSDGHHHAL